MHDNLAVMLTVRVEHQITERQYRNTIIFIKLIKNNRVMHCTWAAICYSRVTMHEMFKQELMLILTLDYKITLN